MSIQAVGWVLDWSPTRGTDRLVLIAIANHAGTSPENGAWEAWPGIETIAREAGLERTRTAQESLARLIRDGHLERVLNGAPDGRIRRDRRPNLYRILTLQRGDAPPHPATDNGVTPPRTPPPVDNLHDGVTPDGTPSAPRGDAPASNGVTPQRVTGCYQASPEPSVEPSMNQPPHVSRAELPPAGASSGGERSDQDPTPALSADERRARIHQAVTILAERAADRSRNVGRRAAWVGAVAERLAGQHAADAHRLLAEHPDLPPVALADLLADPDAASAAEARARQREAEEATHRLIRDTAAQPADRIRSQREAARLHDQLRQPQETPTDA